MDATPQGPAPRVSVLMPTHDHGRFLARALHSLLAQDLADWELVIVDDASADDTPEVLAPFLADPRIRCERLPHNVGLGAALNHALARARAPLIAYLPADDVYHADHLSSLAACLEGQADAVLAYSGVRHHYNRRADGPIAGHGLQLVQVMHRRTDERWLTRRELVTDDLGRMLWERLLRAGPAAASGRVTCEWVDHPGQRHKLLREPEGGINRYRQRYNVGEPLRFHTSVGNHIDEASRYARLRSRPPAPAAAGGLTIVLAGELAYNADRILALEDRGHALHGLWMPDPYWYNTVGPLPFGRVRDLPRAGWREALRARRPDLIYALLNWQAVPFAHAVRRACPELPLVWHFKEGPFICLEKGTWPELVALHCEADGVVYSSEEMQAWFRGVLPAAAREVPSIVVDGDLPLRTWFEGERSPRRSAADGAIHTVVPGRPIGLHPHTVAELAGEGVHLDRRPRLAAWQPLFPDRQEVYARWRGRYTELVVALLLEAGLVVRRGDALAAARPLILWFTTPTPHYLAERLPASLVVFDVMDDLAGFRGAAPDLRRREDALLRRADLVFTGGRSLHAARRDRHPNIHLFPSGVEPEHFARARDPATPVDPAIAGLPRPRLGYIGVIDERLDLGLVDALALADPARPIVMVGPTAKLDPADLPRRPNLHYTGQRPYADLPGLLRGLDVCLMPFARGDATRSLSPTKALEYMAAGHPIVSTPIPDVVANWSDAIAIADGPAAFAAAITDVLHEPAAAREARERRQQAHLADHAWDGVARRMGDLVDAALRRASGAAPAL